MAANQTFVQGSEVEAVTWKPQAGGSPNKPLLLYRVCQLSIWSFGQVVGKKANKLEAVGKKRQESRDSLENE